MTQTEEVIDYLREMGCKVPVMLYSDVQGESEDSQHSNLLLDPEESFQYFKHLMRLRKKYRLLSTSGNINQVKKFCIMRDDIVKKMNTQPTLFLQTFYKDKSN